MNEKCVIDAPIVNFKPTPDVYVHDPEATLKVVDHPVVKIKDLYERFIALEEKTNADIRAIKEAILAINRKMDSY
jgi:hypothetical protein